LVGATRRRQGLEKEFHALKRSGMYLTALDLTVQNAVGQEGEPHGGQQGEKWL